MLPWHHLSLHPQILHGAFQRDFLHQQSWGSQCSQIFLSCNHHRNLTGYPATSPWVGLFCPTRQCQLFREEHSVVHDTARPQFGLGHIGEERNMMRGSSLCSLGAYLTQYMNHGIRTQAETQALLKQTTSVLVSSEFHF